jgi:5'-methylthioadenosine phosphorylase
VSGSRAGIEPRIGIIGGSGFYSLFDEAAESRTVHTPYGSPSGQLTIGEVAGAAVAFVPRHGRHHELPPHRINYRANLWALHSVGCDAIIAPCAAGSLQPDVRPGDIAVCDQLVDRTWGRGDTYYDGPVAAHVSFADPYCPELRDAAIETVREAGLNVHEHATVVVIQGPRFSTRSESQWFRSQGWEVINMTQYPEAVLARELEMCFVNLSLITDYDAGLEGSGAAPVSYDSVMQVLRENNERLRGLLEKLVGRIDPDRTCPCRHALGTAHG